MAKLGIGKNATYFTSALILQKILSFVYFYFLSNNITHEPFGRYVFALSYTSLFSIFIDLGMTQILIRESSRSLEKANAYLKNIITLKIFLAVITFAVLFVFIVISGKSKEVIYLVSLSSVIMILDAFTISFWAIFRSHQNMFYESTATIFVQIIIFIFGLASLFLTHNIFYIMLALVIASVFNFLYSLILLKTKFHYSIMPSWNIDIIRHFLYLLPVFALGGIFVKIYNASDTVLLGFLSSDASVGLYSVPAKVITSLAQIIPSAFVASIYPVFSEYYKNSKEELKKTFLKSFLYIIIISLPITGGLLILIPKILNALWKSYAEISLTFIIMSFAIPFVFLAFPTGYLLLACDRQKNNTINRGIMAAASLTLNFILIPLYGFLGSGIAFLVVNIIVFVLDMIYVRKAIPLHFSDFSQVLTKSLFACIMMMGAVYAISQKFHFVFAILGGMLVYFALLIFLKAVKIQEMKKLLRV